MHFLFLLYFIYLHVCYYFLLTCAVQQLGKHIRAEGFLC